MIAMRKAKTSLDRVIQMTEDERYCVDIIQQNLAVIGLLRSSNSSLLEEHVNSCVKNAAKKGGKALNEKMGELIRVMQIAQTK